MHAISNRRIVRPDRKHRAVYIEALESRVLLTAFSAIDAAGAWNLAGTAGVGSIIFDGAGHVTGGSILDSGGSTNTPSGNYTFTNAGVLTVNSNKGQMNASKDVIAVTKATTNDEALTVLVNPRNAIFSLADLTGTWHLEFNGRDFTNNVAHTNGYGTIIFDGNGNITGGSTTTGGGAEAITGGTYTQSGNEFDFQILTADNSNLQFTGWLNASKTLLAADPVPADFVNAVQNDDTTLLIMVHSTGNYSDADAGGTWRIQGHGVSGSVTLDKHGHIISGNVTSSDGSIPITGTYNVSADGLMKLTARGKNDHGQVETIVFDGAIDASRNTFVMNSTHAENNLTLGIKTAAAPNHAPVMKSISPFGTAVDTLGFSISYAQLMQHARPTDKEGDAVSFIVTSLGGGIFTFDGNPAPATPFTFQAGDTLVWTPPAGAKGNINAFTVKATDGTASSAPLAVKIKTVLFPTVTVSAAPSTASENNNGTSKGVGKFIIKRANGDTTKPLIVTYLMTGTAVNGTNYKLLSQTITIPAGKPLVFLPLVPINDHATTGNLTAILTLQPGANYGTANSATATVTITDVGV